MLAMPLEFTLFHDRAAGVFGYKVRFAGKTDYHHIVECTTAGEALRRADRHQERHWEEADGTEPDALLISRRYREDTLAHQMEQRVLVAETLRLAAQNHGGGTWPMGSSESAILIMRK